MDGLTFTSSVVSSVAWPVGALCIARIFRSDISALLKRLRHIDVGGVSGDFGPALAHVRAKTEQKLAAGEPIGTERAVAGPGWSLSQTMASPDVTSLLQLAQIAPTTAVAETWALLERESGGSQTRPDVAALVADLRRIKDEARGADGQQLSTDSAADYVLTAARVLTLLRLPG